MLQAALAKKSGGDATMDMSGKLYCLTEAKGKGGGKPNLTQGFVPNSLNTEKELVSLFKKYLMQI